MWLYREAMWWQCWEQLLRNLIRVFCFCMSDSNNHNDNLLLLTFCLSVIGFVTLFNNNIISVTCDFVFVVTCILSCFVLFLKYSFVPVLVFLFSYNKSKLKRANARSTLV